MCISAGKLPLLRAVLAVLPVGPVAAAAEFAVLSVTQQHLCLRWPCCSEGPLKYSCLLGCANACNGSITVVVGGGVSAAALCVYDALQLHQPISNSKSTKSGNSWLGVRLCG